MSEETNHSDGDKPAVPSNPLLDRLFEIDRIMRPLAEEKAKINQQLLENRSEFAVGDIIEWKDGAKKGRVVGISEWCCGEPMWSVALILKDGSEGRVIKVRPYQKPHRSNPSRQPPAP